METPAYPLWELWVDPVRRVVSFHPEAGGQYLAFRSRELFLRCIDQYTAQQYRYQ
ncbi:MAG TPA: hypothetical protein H9787_00395 [Candidatus Oscillibacter excrementigallinarum]|uniref:Uncharacterized protein n=1 Tax=Candidatus Oscillibacter excrementigallinarum TaxID=2838716 RepID=A0A9D2LGM3_9FIRM|nr:hypothetical protein [Candidatus Oscillibacter excrementigallinarum]